MLLQYRTMGVDLKSDVESSKLSTIHSIMKDRHSSLFSEHDLRGIIWEAMSVYKNNFSQFYIITLAGFLPVLLVSYLVGTDLRGVIVVSIIDLMIITALAGIYIYSVGYYYVHGRVDLKSALRASQAVYFKLLGVTLALQIMLALVLVAGTILFFLIIPFIVALLYMIYLVLSQPVVVIERHKPLDAFKRSLSLVRGNWWRVFKSISIFFLSVVGIGVLVWLPFFLISLPITEGSELRGLFQQIGTYVGATIIVPLIYIFLTIVYYDLRYRKEDFSFEQLSDEINR